MLWHRHKAAANTTGIYPAYDHGQAPQTLPLPLAICGDTNTPDWHWMATFADLHPHTHTAIDPDIRWRFSRTDHTRLQQLSPKIGTQVVSDVRGRYQNRVIPVMAHPATHITWRAVGDPARIRDLLSDLPAIGKHTNVGEGRVTHWDVVETPEDTAWDAGHEHEPGVLGRSVPPRCVSDRPIAAGALGTTTIRPPYMHPFSRTAAYEPYR